MFRSVQTPKSHLPLGSVLYFFIIFPSFWLWEPLGTLGDPAVTRRYLWGKSGGLWDDFGETLGSLWRDFGRLLKALGGFGEAWGSFGEALGRLWGAKVGQDGPKMSQDGPKGGGGPREGKGSI